jgi:hypothetical protein
MSVVSPAESVASLDFWRERAFGLIVLLAAVLAGLLVALFEPSMLTTDTAQYVSTARNIVAGHGIATDLLYFDQQQVFGTVPAPQTVWPPLFPLAVALLQWLGIEAMWGAFCVALIANFAAPLVLYACVRVAGYGARIALAAAGASLAIAGLSSMVLGGMSEPLYTLLALCAMYGFLRLQAAHGARRGVLLVATGLCCALVYLTRYTGLCLIAAYAAALSFAWLRERTWPRFRDVLLGATVPVLVVMALLWRNYLATGSLSGGPNASLEPSAAGTLRSLFWSLADNFGFSRLPNSFVWTCLAIGGVVVFALYRWRARGAAETSHAAVTDAGALFAAGYIAFSMALITVLSISRYADFVNDRYLLPLWPFAILLLTFLRPPTAQPTGLNRGRGVYWLVAAFGTFLLIGQGLAARRDIGWYRDVGSSRVVHEALAERLEPGTARTVAELLAAEASAEHPLLEMNGQHLGMWLQRPVVGFAQSRFTARVWDQAAVRATAQRFRARYLVFFAAAYSPSAIENRNRPLFTELRAGKTVDWLVPVYRSARLTIYRID